MQLFVLLPIPLMHRRRCHWGTETRASSDIRTWRHTMERASSDFGRQFCHSITVLALKTLCWQWPATYSVSLASRLSYACKSGLTAVVKFCEYGNSINDYDWLEFNGTFSTVRLHRAFRSTYSLRFGKQKHPGSLVHLLFSRWPAT